MIKQIEGDMQSGQSIIEVLVTLSILSGFILLNANVNVEMVKLSKNAGATDYFDQMVLTAATLFSDETSCGTVLYDQTFDPASPAGTPIVLTYPGTTTHLAKEGEGPAGDVNASTWKMTKVRLFSIGDLTSFDTSNFGTGLKASLVKLDLAADRQGKAPGPSTLENDLISTTIVTDPLTHKIKFCYGGQSAFEQQKCAIQHLGFQALDPLTLTPASCTGVSLEVPILMDPTSLSSSGVGGPHTFIRTMTRFNPDDYDHVFNYSFEVVAQNSSGSDQTISLVDQGGVVKATVTAPGGNPNPIRLRTTWTPNTGSNTYYLKLDNPGGAANQLVATNPQILVQQRGATKTRLYFPLLGGPASWHDADDDVAYFKSATFTNSANDDSTSVLYPNTDFALWYKDSSQFGDLDGAQPWSFEALINTSLSNAPGYVALFNATTNTEVMDSELTTSVKQDTDPYYDLASRSFADNASGFDNLNEMEVRGKAPAMRLEKAGIWLKLINLNKGQVAYRVNWGAYTFTPSNLMDMGRILLDPRNFTYPTFQFETTTRILNAGDNADVGLCDQGTSDQGTVGCSILAASKIHVTNVAKARLRSTAFSPTLLHRFVGQANLNTGSLYIGHSMIIVGFSKGP